MSLRCDNINKVHQFAYQYFINNISLSIYEPLGVSETDKYMVRKRVTFPSKVKLLMYIDKYMVKKRVTFPSKVKFI
jgi:predicted DNA-binding transcriptional regulator AlpA